MMKRPRQIIAAGLCLLCVSPSFAQQTSIAPIRPSGPVFSRPYKPVEVPPVRLGNSTRLAALMHAGNLYLTAQDALSLALENNIDIEVARYNQPMLEWRLERSEAGGALPGVPSGASQANSNAAGQGVIGSQQSAGIAGANTGAIRNNTNTTITQIGPVTQNLDPAIQESTTFSHRSLPQSNATVSVLNNLIQNQRAYSGSYQQGFLTGGSVTVAYNEHYLNENAPSDVLNPSVAPTLGISAQHNLLQGFGARVGGRNIRIAKMNLEMSDLTFRSQISRTVAAVLNAYYALVADYTDLRARQVALDTAQSFYTENQRRLDLGAVAQLDVTTAQNQVAAAMQARINSQSLLAQQEVQLKNLISRDGLADPALAAAHVVPLDTLAIPSSDDLPPISELAARALANRPDLLSSKGNIATSEVGLIGTRNGVLPNVQVFASRSSAGLAGTPRIATTGKADPRFVGGMGTALAQLFAQQFPSENAGGGGRLIIGNRQAQADYAIDQLALRQQQLEYAKDQNQAQVDVTNAVVALRQARARYEAAALNRILQSQLYEAEQKKFAAGESTSYNVNQQQRDLASAGASELSALVSYQSARINIDQTTGMLLEANHILIGEVKQGKISQTSTLPADLPRLPLP